MKNPISINLAEPKYRIPEAAKLLCQEQSTTRKWILLRKIAVFRVGKTILIPESEITRILEDGFRQAKS
jgi:excisionase family DNA binding protein